MTTEDFRLALRAESLEHVRRALSLKLVKVREAHCHLREWANRGDDRLATIDTMPRFFSPGRIASSMQIFWFSTDLLGRKFAVV